MPFRSITNHVFTCLLYMLKIKHLLFALFILTFTTGEAQYIGKEEPASTKVAKPKKSKKKKNSVRAQNRRAMVSAIRQLKHGAVLFMIHDNHANSEMLRQKGYDELAKKKEEQLKKRNHFFAHVLATRFTFCPVYFFYEADLPKIQQGQVTGCLLDSSLVKQPNLTFDQSYFLILDYGDVFSSEPGIAYSDTSKPESGRTVLREDCFVFKNKYLGQLTGPFPFEYHCADWKKNLYNCIARMNRRLDKFYRKHAEE